MVVARRPEVLARVRLARSHGMTTSAIDRLSGHAMYDVIMLGYNYRMDELRAAVDSSSSGNWRAGTHDGGSWLIAIVRSWRLSAPGSTFLSAPDRRPRITSFLSFCLPQKIGRAIIDALRKDAVQTSLHYPPIHLLSWYRQRYPDLSLPLTEEFAARELTLPLHPAMDEADIEHVAQALAKALEHLSWRLPRQLAATC